MNLDMSVNSSNILPTNPQNGILVQNPADQKISTTGQEIFKQPVNNASIAEINFHAKPKDVYGLTSYIAEAKTLLGYAGELSLDQAKEIMKGKPEGTYMIITPEETVTAMYSKGAEEKTTNLHLLEIMGGQLHIYTFGGIRQVMDLPKSIKSYIDEDPVVYKYPFSSAMLPAKLEQLPPRNFMSDVTGGKADTLLAGQEKGTYLTRPSSGPNIYGSLSVVNEYGVVEHNRIAKVGDMFHFPGDKILYATIEQLIASTNASCPLLR